MFEIMYGLLFALWYVVSLIIYMRKSFQIAYYETWIERMEREGIAKPPESYKEVKTNFWAFLKSK